MTPVPAPVRILSNRKILAELRRFCPGCLGALPPTMEENQVVCKTAPGLPNFPSFLLKILKQ